MKSRRWCRALPAVLVLLCGLISLAATEAEVTPTPTEAQTPPAVSSARAGKTIAPVPGTAETVETRVRSNGTAGNETTSVGNSTVSENGTMSQNGTLLLPTTNTTLNLSTSTVDFTLPTTEAPTTTTMVPLDPPAVCLCNLTPDVCDIGCCCDTVDCGVANLDSVFTGCTQKVTLGVCVEKWLMYKANINPTFITVTDTLFCVQPEGKPPASQAAPAVSQFPLLGSSFHFSPPGLPPAKLHTRNFYRVDNVILTYFSDLSVRDLLRQPSPGLASESCVDGNPVQFLRSTSWSCTRMVTQQSCTSDPKLDALSYFSDFSLIKIPVAEMEPQSDLLIPIAPVSNWPSPSQLADGCSNVVKHVKFAIGYTRHGELTHARVDVVLANVTFNQLLSQTHSVQFERSLSSMPVELIPPVGLTLASPLVARFGQEKELGQLTVMGLSQGGRCSSDPSKRSPVLFRNNVVTGCMFMSQSNNCSELQSQIRRILLGLAAPDQIAMDAGSKPDWTKVVFQDCPAVKSRDTCEFGCPLPESLSIQVLWARQGLLDLPQSYILGAKYVFRCQQFKCPSSSPITLTTSVIFADATVYPDPPRGAPQPWWNFPFGFFSRGAEELDSHIINSTQPLTLTWSAMLLMLMIAALLL